MKKISLLVATFCITIFVSCKKEETPDPQPQEFIADSSFFKDYKSWTLDGEVTRTDKNEYRKIYINKASEVDRTTGSYPTGTIIVKEISHISNHDSVLRYQVLVKRGGNFNPQGNGWEWFLMMGNDVTKITTHGDNSTTINGTTCISCHTGQNDLVFTTY